MAGPLQIILYIHNAFLKDFADLEEATKSLNYDDQGDAAAIADRFRRLRSYLAAHEETEEHALFPAIEERFRHSSATYAFDHDHHLGFYDAIDGLLDTLQRSRGPSDRRIASRQLYRESVALRAVMVEHIEKENQLLLPAFDTDFSAQEQGAILGKMLAHPPPPDMDMAAAAQWVFAAQDVNGREAFLRDYLAIMPPEQQTPFVSMLSTGVPAPEWSEMTRRIPDLSRLSDAQPRRVEL